MKLLLLQNQIARNIYELKPESFHYKVEIPVPENPDTGADESQVMENYYFNDALIEISSIDQDYDAIVISHWLFPESTGLQPPNDQLSSFFSAVQLASFIRLEDDDFVRNSPIIIISGYPESEILRDSFHRPELLFASYGTRLIPEIELTWDLPDALGDDPFGSEEIEFSVKTVFKLPTRDDIQKNFHELIRKRLLITDNSTDSHSVANHFGAFRIANLLGQKELIRWPRNLYFNYLISRSVEPDREKLVKIPTSFKKLKVLIVDDQVHNGWKDVLDLIFPLGVKAEPAWNKQIEQEIQLGFYDLVLLDYRLGETGPEGKNGLDRLRQIKGSFKRNDAGEIEKDENGNSVEEYPGLNPVMPVIMFTASNKAWNMDALYEAGADGYYIKEHPDTASDADFSVNNLNSFIQTIDRCGKKGRLLKPYWRALQDIESLFTAGEGPIREKTLSDDNRSNFRGRISERIKMFIGLLKKAYEQTAFDEKAFFYSDYELAYLTLWSVLNEFQECFFEKLIGFENIEGNPEFVQKFHEDEDFTPLVSSWRFENATPYIRYEAQRIGKVLIRSEEGFFKTTPKSNFNKVNWEIKSFNESRDINWELKISNHILFAIQNIKTTKDGTFIKKLSINLLELNKFRNKLFLTHGGVPNSPNFAMLYKNNRVPIKTWETMIPNLFSIVYFLCTAEEWSPQK
jgi:CheY-like chemotaxis protein